MAHKRILRALGNGPTRRNLFGPVDREQLQREYRDALRKDLEDASRRWSFDFVAEKPLEGGDFRWVGVSGVRVPVLYRSCEDARNPAGSPGKENRFGSVPQGVEKTPEKRAEMKRKQTNITGERYNVWIGKILNVLKRKTQGCIY